MKKILFTLAAALALSACAKNPGAIPPVPMGNVFDGMNCTAALHELSAERHRLSILEGQQRAAATGDAIGVLFILLPVGSLTGADIAGEVGASKGKIAALENRLLACKYQGR